MPRAKVEHRTDQIREQHNIRMKRYYSNHPEQREKLIEKIKNRYATDETYRELVKQRSKERKLRLKLEKAAKLEAEKLEALSVEVA